MPEEWKSDPITAWLSPDSRDVVADQLERTLREQGCLFETRELDEAIHFSVMGHRPSLRDALRGRPARFEWAVATTDEGTVIRANAVHTARIRQILRRGYLTIFFLTALLCSLPLVVWADYPLRHWATEGRAALNIFLIAVSFSCLLTWDIGIGRALRTATTVRDGMEKAGIRLRAVLRAAGGIGGLPPSFVRFGIPLAAALGFLPYLILFVAFGLVGDALDLLLQHPVMPTLIIGVLGLIVWGTSIGRAGAAEMLQRSIWAADMTARVVIGMVFFVPVGIYWGFRQAALAPIYWVATLLWIALTLGLLRYGAKALSTVFRTELDRRQSAGEDYSRWVTSRWGMRTRTIGATVWIIAFAALVWMVSASAVLTITRDPSIAAKAIAGWAIVPAGLHLVLSSSGFRTRGKAASVEHHMVSDPLSTWLRERGVQRAQIPHIICIDHDLI